MAVAFVALMSCSAAYAQARTVSPADVATPTPAPAPLILVPTATPRSAATTDGTVASGAPVASDALRAATRGAYFHGDGDGVRTYRVQAGDTLLDVALETGVDLTETYCLVAPDFAWSRPLVVGDLLTVPRSGALCHEIQPGETLEDVAVAYGVTTALLRAERWNATALPPGDQSPLPAGWHLRVPPRPTEPALIPEAMAGAPGDAQNVDALPLLLSQPVGAAPEQSFAVAASFAGSDSPPMGGPGLTLNAPVPADWPYGTGDFAWPLFGWLTQDFTPHHKAIDIAAPTGTMVTAADRGVVIRAGWNSQGYGQFVIIDHNIDYITLYAHLSEVLVSQGDVVAQGQAIGRVGSTGNSTGPHLHFEIRDFGSRADPVPLLVK